MPPRVREHLAEPTRRVWLSAASVWEMAIKRSLGKLGTDLPLARLVDQQCRAMRLQLLEIRRDHALAVESLPWHHCDPFDRLLVAQAMVEELELVSADEIPGDVRSLEGVVRGGIERKPSTKRARGSVRACRPGRRDDPPAQLFIVEAPHQVEDRKGVVVLDGGVGAGGEQHVGDLERAIAEPPCEGRRRSPPVALPAGGGPPARLPVHWVGAVTPLTPT